MTTLTKIKLQNGERGRLRNNAKRTKKGERHAAPKRCQEIDEKGWENWRLHRVKILIYPNKKRPENWWLHRVKILKYPLEKH